MEASAMDLDAGSSASPQPQPSPLSSSSFPLRTTIQTNFGDDYVLQISPNQGWSSMAVALSTNSVKLYSPEMGQFLGECRGHTGSINQVGFNGVDLLCSCGSDGTVRAWDTRSFRQVSLINAGPNQEVFSFSFGGSGNLLAGGCKSQILFWDWRTMKQIACLEECHVDDVTQVHFFPGDQNKLLSASVDGLMCTFDTTGDINDDEHLESVMNVGTSVGKVGFLGDKKKKLWCLTHIETLSIWDWREGRLEVDFQEARLLASENWSRDHVDYFVDCHSSGDDDNLWVIGGTNAGTIGYFPVSYSGRGLIGPCEAILEGGHSGIVRSVLPASYTALHAKKHGIFGWTGGEDGRLCCWLADNTTSDVSRAWMSSSLVMKSLKSCKNRRHQPY
ncbi:WD repeat-containing protein [Drosera capensis]